MIRIIAFSLPLCHIKEGQFHPGSGLVVYRPLTRSGFHVSGHGVYFSHHPCSVWDRPKVSNFFQALLIEVKRRSSIVGHTMQALGVRVAAKVKRIRISSLVGRLQPMQPLGIVHRQTKLTQPVRHVQAGSRHLRCRSLLRQNKLSMHVSSLSASPGRVRKQFPITIGTGVALR